MEATNFILFLSGLFGVLVHILMKIDSLNRKFDGEVNYSKFFRVEWASIAISVIVVGACVMGRHGISQLEIAGAWLALGYFGIGLAAQSVAYFFKGKTEKIFTEKP